MSKGTSSGRTGSSVLHQYGGLRASTLAALCAAFLSGAAAWAVAEYPSNGHIVYEYKELPSGTRGIWYMKADGTGNVELAADASWPKWRPDGTKIAYIKNDETWVMSHDGSGKTKLTSLRVIQWWGTDTDRLVCRNSAEDCYEVTYPGGTETLLARKSDFTKIADRFFLPEGLTWDGRWLLGRTDRYRNGYTGDNGYFDHYWSAIMLDMNDRSKVYYFGGGCEPTAPPTGNYIYHVSADIMDPSPARMEKGDTSRSTYQAEIAHEEADWGHEYCPIISTDNVWMTYCATCGCHSHETCAYQLFIHRLGAGSDNRMQLTNNGHNQHYSHCFVGTLPGTDTVSIDSFTAAPSTITEGQSSTLFWTTTNATKVSIDHGVGSDLAKDGSKSVSPAATTTYTLTAEGTGGPVTAQVAVTVIETVTVPFRMNCGVNSYTPSGWGEDDAYVTGGDDYEDWTVPVDATGVANAAPSSVYQTVRHGLQTYTIPIVNGSYVVRLHLGDGYESGGAPLVRDAAYVIEGVTVEEHMDYNTEAGAPHRALVRDYDVDVTDGDIVIECTSYGFEGGIEILAGGSAPVLTTINVTPSTAAIGAGGTQGFTAQTLDQFGDPITAGVTWSVDGGGSVSPASGASTTFTSDGTAGGFTVTAASGGVTGTATVDVTTQPTITLIQPNGGEVWYVGTTRHIEWTAVGVGDVAVSYWSGHNGTWLEIAQSVKVTDTSWGDYPWTVSDAPGADCLVNIADYGSVADAAQSADVFEIRSVTDSDSDGMDDGWETQHFGDLSHDGTADTDGDGLTDYDEFMQYTDPLVSDSVVDDSGGTGLGCAPVGRRRGSGSCASATVLLLALVLARRKRPV